MITYDTKTIDSAGSFLVGELERLDQTLHAPLVDFTWTRDIDLREDVSIGDETSSFTNSTFASVGGISPTGKAWIGKDANTIVGMALDIGKTASPLYLWGMEIGFTIPELESARQVGRPIDDQKLIGLKLKHNMDIDEMVYIGDTELGKYGLVNASSVSTGFVANGAALKRTWASKTPAEILVDVNELLTSAWAAAGWKVCPSRLLLPPVQFAYINTPMTIGGVGGFQSIAAYIAANSLCNQVNGKPLEILHCKWLTGRGVAAGSPSAATDRMVAYTKAKDRVRYPMVPLQRTPLEYRSIYQLTTYFGRLGVVEVVYPETILYRDGL